MTNVDKRMDQNKVNDSSSSTGNSIITKIETIYIYIFYSELFPICSPLSFFFYIKYSKIFIFPKETFNRSWNKDLNFGHSLKNSFCFLQWKGIIYFSEIDTFHEFLPSTQTQLPVKIILVQAFFYQHKYLLLGTQTCIFWLKKSPLEAIQYHLHT